MARSAAFGRTEAERERNGLPGQLKRLIEQGVGLLGIVHAEAPIAQDISDIHLGTIDECAAASDVGFQPVNVLVMPSSRWRTAAFVSSIQAMS